MSEISYEEMVDNLAKPGADIINGLTEESAHLWHMATGISGEIGEIVENILEGKSIENFTEEVGDTEFYLQGLCKLVGLPTDTGKSCLMREPTKEGYVLYASMYASQILDAVKKATVYEKELNIVKLEPAVLGLTHALAGLYTVFGTIREDALQQNMDKLSVRYSEGSYSNKAASERNDKAGTEEEEPKIAEVTKPTKPKKTKVSKDDGDKQDE